MGINGYWYAFYEIEPQDTDGQGGRIEFEIFHLDECIVMGRGSEDDLDAVFQAVLRPTLH